MLPPSPRPCNLFLLLSAFFPKIASFSSSGRFSHQTTFFAYAFSKTFALSSGVRFFQNARMPAALASRRSALCSGVRFSTGPTNDYLPSVRD